MNTLYLSQVGPIEGPSPKPRSGHRIVYHKGKIYSFGGFNPAVDGADPDLEGDEYWQDSKPLFKVGLQIASFLVNFIVLLFLIAYCVAAQLYRFIVVSADADTFKHGATSSNCWVISKM